MVMSNDSYQSMGKAIFKKPSKHFTWFDVLNYILLVIIGLICLFPVLYELLLSFSSQADYLRTPQTLIPLPTEFNIDAYKVIFAQGTIPQAFLISLTITILGTLYSMILTMLGAYSFTKKNVPGLKIFFTFVLITMFFSGGLIPFFLVVSNTIGIENLWCLVIPFGINAFNLIIMKNFFSQVPTEVIESAELEGASEFRILFKIVIPLSGPGLATILLWYVISYWDAWYWASFFVQASPELQPLAYVLRTILTSGIDGNTGTIFDLEGTKTFTQATNAAAIMISILPILIFYPFLQKYFVKGQMAGAVKG